MCQEDKHIYFKILRKKKGNKKDRMFQRSYHVGQVIDNPDNRPCFKESYTFSIDT